MLAVAGWQWKQQEEEAEAFEVWWRSLETCLLLSAVSGATAEAICSKN